MKSILSIFVILLNFGICNSQVLQKNLINYQGLAKDANGEILSEETLNIQIGLKFGAPEIASNYIENHVVDTDESGVFSLLIGAGTAVTGDYDLLEWNDLAVYVNLSINGVEIGTTELLAVPYAITSGDNQWRSTGNDIVNKNSGNIGINRNPTSRLDINGDLRLQTGTAVSEISTDETLAGNSNNAIPTERAVKTYVDNATASEAPVVFKVRGNGFAVKDLDGQTTIETDIWDVIVYDTRNAFNTTTDRFVVPESGYYHLQAVVRQSNTVTSAFFRISFNIDSSARYSQIVDGDDVKTTVSGVYFLTAGQEIYANLRNFSAGIDVRIDGTGSWFEGFKIN